jgi:hypothetical protein
LDATHARVPDWLVGLPAARYLDQAGGLLALRRGDCAYDVACGPGFNLRRLADAVGPSGLVIAVEDNAQLLAEARRKIRHSAGRTSACSTRWIRTPSSGARSMGSSSATTRPSSSNGLTSWKLLGDFCAPEAS